MKLNEIFKTLGMVVLVSMNVLSQQVSPEKNNIIKNLNREYFISKIIAKSDYAKSTYCENIGRQLANSKCEALGDNYIVNYSYYTEGVNDYSYRVNIYFKSINCTGYIKFSCKNIFNEKIIGFEDYYTYKDYQTYKDIRKDIRGE